MIKLSDRRRQGWWSARRHLQIAVRSRRAGEKRNGVPVLADACRSSLERTSGPIARICRAQAGQQDRKMRSEEETIELLRTISTGETPRNSALKIFTERLHSRFSICFHSASVRASTKSSCRLSHDMGCRPVLPVFFKRFNDEVGHHLVTKRVEVSVVG